MISKRESTSEAELSAELARLQSKLDKAQQLEIPVLSEDAFLQLLDGESGQ